MQIIQLARVLVLKWLSVNKDVQGKACPQLYFSVLLKMLLSISSSAMGIF